MSLSYRKRVCAASARWASAFIILVTAGSAAAVDETEGPIRELVAKPQWSMPQSGGAEGQPYFIEPHQQQRGELLGAYVDNLGNVYICDRITDQLIKLNPRGEEVFAIGSLGDGPEDHRGFGEVLPWPGGHIARTDCVLLSKVLIYDVDGAFLWDIKLDFQETMTRLFWNGENAIGSFTWFDYDPSGSPVETSLRLLNEDGVEIKKIPMGHIFMKPNQPPTLEETWIYPYVSVSADGYCFVQQDLYGDEVDCYDQDLNKLWTIDGGWTPIPFTPEERAESEKRKISGTMHQTIQRMFARDSGEVWIQPWTLGPQDAFVEFESFGRSGVSLGAVRIFGLPQGSGSWALHGDKILWIADGDAGATPKASAAAPYLAVFDLISR